MDSDGFLAVTWPVSSLFCVVAAVVAVLVWWQCCVTFKLMQSAAFTPSQKWFKAALLWFVPVVGTYAVHYAVLNASQHDGKQGASSRPSQKNRRAIARRRRLDRLRNKQMQREGVSTQS
jgi:hypothetical protein